MRREAIPDMRPALQEKARAVPGKASPPGRRSGCNQTRLARTCRTPMRRLKARAAHHIWTEGQRRVSRCQCRCTCCVYPHSTAPISLSWSAAPCRRHPLESYL